MNEIDQQPGDRSEGRTGSMTGRVITNVKGVARNAIVDLLLGRPGEAFDGRKA